MLSRFLALSVTAAMLSAATTSAQTVTFSVTTYPNNLWSQNGFMNGHVKADLNNDGLEDFISENDASFNSGCSGSFAIAMSKGDGTYAEPVCYTIPNGHAAFFAPADLYSRGYFDLVVANEYGDVYVYQNSGTGALQLKNNFTISGEPSGMIAVDTNRDGNFDLVFDVNTVSGAPPTTLYVLFGNGDGTFTNGPVTTFPFPGQPAGTLSIGDFDNDGGHVDLLVHGAGGTGAMVLYGDGAGHFTAGPSVGGSTTNYTVADFDSDGTMDLAGALVSADPYGTTTYYNYLDLEWGHSNRTLTSQHVPLKSCTPGAAAPAVADFDGDGIQDIAVVETADCNGNGPYTLNILLGNGDGTFKPEQVVYSTSDEMFELQVLRAGRDTKPDLVVFAGQLNGKEFSNPVELLMLNTSNGNFPSCNPPASEAIGINLCGPTSSTGATSPVKFSLASANQRPARDFELWVDGNKVVDNFKNTYSYYSFIDASVPMASGQHKIDIYAKSWDNTEIFTTFPLTVGSDICPLLPPGYVGINVCSPLQTIQETTVSSPVLAYARGTTSETIVRMEVWVDGVKQYSTFGSDTLKTQITLSPGKHSFTYYLVTTSGVVFSSQEQVTVQ